MYKQKAVISMTSLSVGNQITKAQIVEEALEQPQYSAVTPTPPEVNAILSQLIPLQAQCEKRNYEAIPLRNDLVRQLQQALRQQCDSVNMIAKGDPAYLAFCGFSLSKIPTPHHEPEQGVIKQILDKSSGTAIFKLKSLSGCKFYELEIEGPGDLKVYLNATVAKFKVADLPQGVIMNARVRGINGKGQGAWSTLVQFSLSLTANVNLNSSND